ncbi:hypothetical protein LPJ78_002927 [Coemansia sp. RSA 989]|nr:hypothetical protein LPJ68_002648 [Coemansia sp. RSA 1086]KAJ1865127.1 hypothetical protein LPJ78_002927 [Coemansia sp. RSA 989]KAJ1875009.1 hypothetical protein LPJ55_001084 [Coemansia sp. RSA 990]KAJ2632949.1 hypothetical protein H4R22_000848 [Coemansia sp. RSA 1290]KAJ2675442.1 hypothetical protein IWW42_001228 [Coemansia sp. RSA 1085]
MGDAQINSVPVFRPLLNFRLSQRPPATRRLSRRQSSQTESIEDDSFSESTDADFIVDDFESSSSSMPANSPRLPGHEPTACLTPLTVSSPILSLDSTAPTNHKPCSAQPSRGSLCNGAPLLKPIGRVPLSPLQTSNKQSTGSPGRSINHAFTSLRATSAQQPQGTMGSSPAHTPSQFRMPFTPSRRPQLGPRADMVSPSTPHNTMPLSSASSRVQTLMPSPSPQCQQTPTKRARRMGPAASEFARVASQEVSEFCMWSHCLRSESDVQFVCQKPQPSLRLHIYSAERVLDPHLFSASAKVLEGSCSDLLLERDQPIAALLSFAVCLDSMPQTARQMMQAVSSLSDASTPLTIAVYPPLRVRGGGEQQCLLATRFCIE